MPIIAFAIDPSKLQLGRTVMSEHYRSPHIESTRVGRTSIADSAYYILSVHPDATVEPQEGTSRHSQLGFAERLDDSQIWETFSTQT